MIFKVLDIQGVEVFKVMDIQRVFSFNGNIQGVLFTGYPRGLLKKRHGYPKGNQGINKIQGLKQYLGIQGVSVLKMGILNMEKPI